jgi:hypothetical protein
MKLWKYQFLVFPQQSMNGGITQNKDKWTNLVFLIGAVVKKNIIYILETWVALQMWNKE